MNINFLKLDEIHLLSYYYYVSQVSNNDLFELNGYKIRNILSVVFDKKIHEIVLEDLFNTNGTFLSSETKDNLFRYLSSEERIDLQNSLSAYLDHQIQSKWLQTITEILNNESIRTLLIPTAIINHNIILNHLKKIFPKIVFVDWHGFNDTTTALILDYNHGWKKQNLFTLKESNSKAFFINHFFENTYQWKVYSEERHLFNRMNTPTRVSLLGEKILTEVKEKLLSLRPRDAKNEWDILDETNHKNSFNTQEEIVIYYSATNSNRYRINASFLLVKDCKYIFKNAKDLVKNPSQFEEKFEFSNIENIIAQIDLGKLNKAIQKDKSLDYIVQPLWHKFNLKKEDGTLWKQLLSIKSAENGMEKVYTEIERISGIKKFITFNTFENTYCNPKSSTIIPREKKIFKAICQYLDLDDNYRKFIHRERNLIGGHSQELNSKLKELVKVIIEIRVLDYYKNDDALLKVLTLSIDEIEKSVDMEFFGYTKDSLLYSCIELCYEIIDKMRLRPIHKIDHANPN